MPFRYVAATKKGEVKRGFSELPSRDAVVRDLIDQGLIIVSVESAEQFQAARQGVSFFGHVSHLDKVLFTKHLSIMLRAGLTLLESLKILEGQAASWSMRRVIRGLIQDVETGKKFSDGLDKFPKVFSRFYANIIRAGETSGNLSENLDHLAVQFTKDHELIMRVRSAMLYPAIVLTAASAIGFFFAVYVLPQVAGLFSSLQGIQLPWITLVLLKVADIARQHTFLAFFGIVGTVAAVVWILRLPILAPITHRLALRVPIFGKLVKDVNLARYSLVLGTMLKSGIPITEAVRVTSDVLNNVRFKAALARAVKDMEGGNPLSESLLRSQDVFPLIVSRMINVGEHTGNLENVLGYLAEFYELEVDTTTKNLSVVLEPVLLLFIGLVALAMAYAILIPIYQFISAIRRI